MRIVEHIKEGLQNLYFSKLRSLLALLGVLVGTASVVAMVLGGELATNEALKQFEALGTDLLAISINTSTDDARGANEGKAQDLTLDEALTLENVSPAILSVAPYTQIFSQINFQGQMINGLVLGVTDSFSKIVKVKLLSGRPIYFVDRYNFYCVIGYNIYQSIQEFTHQDPIGQTIQIGKNIFVIVGIAAPWPENNFVYANIDNAILIPLLASSMISKYATINNIILRLGKNADINSVESQVTEFFQKNVAGKEISFRSAKELINKMKKESQILTVFLGLIGSISLIVGGIGVMNIMLVSVVERRREIGIRLAVGAKKKDISILFLTEAVILTLVGGTIGVVIGILIAYIISIFWQWSFVLFLWPPLAGFSVSVAVGIFFGFYPAYKAAQLDPIEALRTD